MKKVSKENQIVFLLKSMKREYLQNTIKRGIFCFNHPTVFSKWEDDDAAQFDRWEAHDAYEGTHIVYAPIIEEKDGMPVYGKGRKLADKAVIHMQSDAIKHTPICCFRFIDQSEYKMVGDTMYYSLGETACRIKREFGHDAYVIIQIIPFLERLKEKAGSFLAMDVAYQDLLNNYKFNVDKQYEEIVQQLFRKDKKYEWQREYRIALPPTKDSPTFVELGSIEDIAISGNIVDLQK